MQHPKLSRILEDLRQRLAQLYGERLVQLVLYGSQARGDAVPDSDIDVLVVLADAVDPAIEIEQIGEIITDLCLEYGAMVMCLFVSEGRFKDDDTPILRHVRKEGMLV
jgi:predicted nucleotidyltransferase